MKHVMTVDLEYGYKLLKNSSVSLNNYNRNLRKSTRQLLKAFYENDIKATFFVVGFLARQVPDLIKEITERGHEIGCHGYLHRDISKMNVAEFRSDLYRNLDSLWAVDSGLKIKGFRAPKWSMKHYMVEAREIIREVGFQYDSSFCNCRLLSGVKAPNEVKIFTTKYGDLKEIPLPTVPIAIDNVPFTGGLSFMYFPYKLIEALTEASKKSLVFYTHPWEVDCGMLDKWCRLFKDFEFGTVEEVYRI